jgi:general secretion pathway protein D
MLGQVGLAYTVRNESLWITTPNGAKTELKWKAYYIGDLTMKHDPPSIVRPKTGMERYKEAMDVALGRSTGFNVNNQSPVFAPVQPVSMHGGWNDQSGMGRMPSSILAQTLDSGYRPGGGYGGNFGGYGNNAYGNGRMGSAGGGANFGELISLIMETIDPDSWRDGGGTGGLAGGTSFGDTETTEQGEATIREYYNTLTLIIRQTEENHQKISDLLKQLRKMNDIQINVEVRFITIQDDFFESMGMDFDFSFRNSQASKYAGLNTTTDDDGTTSGNSAAFTNAVKKGSLFAGLRSGSASTPDFSNDLSVSSNQNSFGLSVPTFGNYDPAAGASLGFAILSDIETYFFINAAQGDSRSNILQAPKVTMINGQTAMVGDLTDHPFVTSFVPVVGDFSVAYQPVITIFQLGTSIQVQAVVSSDRRYVRIYTAPTFSGISDTVSTFTYDGSSGVNLGGSGGGGTGNNNTGAAEDRGMTVQQPITHTFFVETTVSVPDGGTILMGGVKRLSEGRKEYGVPMLNKIPYLKRLFSNTAVGRETQSMMIMVTPHIIIQEEYEESMNTAATNFR